MVVFCMRFYNFLVSWVKIKRKQLYVGLVVFSAFVFLSAIIHVVNVIMLKKSVANVFESLNNYGIVRYKLSSNVIVGNVFVEDFEIQSPNGSQGCDLITIKKTGGIFGISEVNLKLDGVKSTFEKNKKKYLLKQYGNEDGFYINLGGFFFQKPTFNGIRMSSPLKIAVLDEDKESGEIRIDDFAVAIKNNRKESKYIGSMIFHDTEFLPYVFLLDTPFKWDVRMQTVMKKEQINDGKKKRSIDVNELKVNKFIMDFGFSKVSASGKIDYASQIRNLDLNVNIENDAKFIDNMFNMVLRDNSSLKQQVREIRSSVKKIINQLKKNSDKSTENVLDLQIKKTEIMPDYIINDIGLNEIIEKLSK